MSPQRKSLKSSSSDQRELRLELSKCDSFSNITSAFFSRLVQLLNIDAMPILQPDLCEQNLWVIYSGHVGLNHLPNCLLFHLPFTAAYLFSLETLLTNGVTSCCSSHNTILPNLSTFTGTKLEKKKKKRDTVCCMEMRGFRAVYPSTRLQKPLGLC